MAMVPRLVSRMLPLLRRLLAEGQAQGTTQHQCAGLQIYMRVNSSDHFRNVQHREGSLSKYLLVAGEA